MSDRSNEEIGLALRQSVLGMSDHRVETSLALVEPEDSPRRDWSAALDLVREASEAIRIRDERATEMEIEHRLDAERASEEIRSLQEQLDETELRLAETEARARTAEARASEAEAWLAKMHDAIVTSFGRVLGDSATEADLRAAFMGTLRDPE